MQDIMYERTDAGTLFFYQLSGGRRDYYARFKRGPKPGQFALSVYGAPMTVAALHALADAIDGLLGTEGAPT